MCFRIAVLSYDCHNKNAILISTFYGLCNVFFFIRHDELVMKMKCCTTTSKNPTKPTIFSNSVFQLKITNMRTTVATKRWRLLHEFAFSGFCYTLGAIYFASYYKINNFCNLKNCRLCNWKFTMLSNDFERPPNYRL